MKYNQNRFSLPRLSSIDQSCMVQFTSPQQTYARRKIKKLNFPDNFQTDKQNLKYRLIQSCIINRQYEDKNDITNQSILQNKLKSINIDSNKKIQHQTKLVGQSAPFQFFKKYKKLNKLLMKRQMIQTSVQEHELQKPLVNMLERGQSLSVFPMCLGLVKIHGQASAINLSDYNLGDKYVMTLSAGIKNFQLIQRIFLTNNRITDISCSDLCQSITNNLKILELSKNKITFIHKNLIKLIGSVQSKLQVLGLSHNLLKESNIIQVLNQVKISNHLKRLDLRNNKIGSHSSNILCEVFAENKILQQIYLSQNHLNGKSAENIFKVLAKNNSLKILDFKLNNLGELNNNNLAKIISSFLSSNKSLHHLDLSRNNFNKQQSIIISQGLSQNKSIYGFHFSGNYGYINPKGFLVINEREITQLSQIQTIQINSYQIVCIRQNQSDKSHIHRNVCWICEGWVQMQFSMNLPASQNQTLVYIHFQFQLYQPRLISLSHKVHYFAMVPPRKFKYFYSIAPDHEIIVDKKANICQLIVPQQHKYIVNRKQITFKVKTVNQNYIKAKKIVDLNNKIDIRCIPRWDGLTPKKVKIPWTYQISMWAKQWRLQDQSLIQKCFERDWKCSKLQNFIKNLTDQQKVKELLRKNYKNIKNLYKQFSSWSPFGDIWAVSNQPFAQFCNLAKITSKQTPLKIIDLTFITTNSMSNADWKSSSVVPERGLVRFQFMQSLVRLSDQKYKKLGLFDNIADSINQLLCNHVIPLSYQYDPHEWRLKKYFIEQNDLLVKKYRPLFSAIYKRNSKLKRVCGQKPFMCLAQFQSILQRSGVYSLVPEREVYLAFNNGMMTYVDELQTQKFMKMSQIQFVEAVARVAECLPGSYTIQDQQNPQLYHKFEWLCQQLRQLAPEEVSFNYPDLQKSMFPIQIQQ